jgi:nucleoside-diphosphate-sugar epimerase
VINAFIFEGITRGSIKIYGDGTQKRPFASLSSVVGSIKKWVVEEEEQSELVIDFNASLNELKDWLLSKIPNLEYQYLNQNQKFLSQSFKGYNNNINGLLTNHFNEFYDVLQIHSGSN